MDADVSIVGAVLAGVLPVSELVERGNTVLVVVQENAANLGGQTFWLGSISTRATAPVARTA